MNELSPLCDFPVGVANVKTMADGSPRFTFEAEESANKFLSLLGECQAQKRYLHLVIYDENQFQTLIDQSITKS